MTTVRQDRVSRLPEAIMLSASLLVVLAIALLSYRNGVAARDADLERKLAQQVESENAILLSTLKDAETGQRGYLLTGEEQYLEPYRNAVKLLPELLEQLKAATANQPDQNGLVRKIEPLVVNKLAELKQTIELRRSGKLEEALGIVNSDRGKRYMDELREASEEIARATQSRQEKYEADFQNSALRLRTVSISGGAMIALFVIIS